MTLPSSEPPGLGVGPDTIRRWQDRGLIGPRNSPAQAVRPNVMSLLPLSSLAVRVARSERPTSLLRLSGAIGRRLETSQTARGTPKSGVTRGRCVLVRTRSRLAQPRTVLTGPRQGRGCTARSCGPKRIQRTQSARGSRMRDRSSAGSPSNRLIAHWAAFPLLRTRPTESA